MTNTTTFAVGDRVTIQNRGGGWDGVTGTVKTGTVNAVTAFQANGTPGVATFGPSAIASITVRNGIITAIS